MADIQDNYQLYIKTVQSQSIKILIESLKEVLTDINIYFDSNGFKIMTMDNVRVALVYVRLLKDNFEEYYCEYKQIDISEEKFEIPDISYDSVISMPSIDLQKYCRDLSIISNLVTISNDESKFILESNGDFASQRIIIGEAQNGLIFSKKNQNVCESFDLKYLNSFTKSTNLCSTVEIFLKMNYPLVIEYNVANLGKLQYCLAPKVKEE